ncbi:uncharacterized protein LOC123916098 [Trifolium pratense]|uniref:uncharacterized protein LOC123916098 n=1 Tax=Trifolium pratense TaxID=57577 RepID=UPI001E694E37|nr:uncharacterized protein LOC123916098 [Trifolium pratense]
MEIRHFHCFKTKKKSKNNENANRKFHSIILSLPKSLFWDPSHGGIECCLCRFLCQELMEVVDDDENRELNIEGNREYVVDDDENRELNIEGQEPYIGMEFDSNGSQEPYIIKTSRRSRVSREFAKGLLRKLTRSHAYETRNI